MLIVKFASQNLVMPEEHKILTEYYTFNKNMQFRKTLYIKANVLSKKLTEHILTQSKETFFEAYNLRITH